MQLGAYRFPGDVAADGSAAPSAQLGSGLGLGAARLVDALPMTDGYRPIKSALAGLDLSDGPQVLAWDPRAQRYQPTAASTARSA